MARPSARRILAELLPVLLVLLCLGGGLALVIATHRRFPPEPKPVVQSTPEPIPVETLPAPVPQASAPEPPREPEPAPDPPPDPTGPILDEIARQVADERARTQAADQKVQATEQALASARSELDRLSHQEGLLKAHADELNRYADMLEREADLLSRHRDVLAQKRDEEIREFARIQNRSKDSYAVLPYRGENGTWRRPIAIECRNGTAKLQPDGREYSILELADSLSLRGSPIVADVARKIIEASRETPPDGARVVPYILFVIRPDGVRAYYEARGQLERLGIAFGYELVGDDLPIDYPSADDPMHWSDSDPAPGDVLAQGGAKPSNNPYVWPQTPPAEVAKPGLSAVEMELLNAANGPQSQPGSQPRSGPFPNLRDGPPIRYVPDPRTLARGNGLPGSDELGPGTLAPGSGRSGSGSGPFPPVPGRSHGSASTTDSGQGRGASGLSPEGLALQPVPSVPGAGQGQYQGSGLSPNPGSEVATGNGPNHQPGFRSGPFPSTPPGGLEGGLASGTVNEGGKPGLVGATGSSAGNRPPGSSLPGQVASGSPAPGGSGGGGRPSDVAPGSTALGGARGVNPLGAVVARALAGGGGLGGKAGSPSRSSLGASESELTRQFREELAAAGGGGLAGQGQGSGSGTSGTAGGLGSEAQGQGSNSSRAGSADAGGQTGQGGQAGGAGAPGMVSTTSNPPAWMTDQALPITLACDPTGVLIQPGGYRLSRGALESSHLLHDRLKAIVKNAETHAHGQPVKPKVQFVIEPGGEETFWLVRRQTVFAGTDWPATVRLVESGGLETFTGRLRR